MLISNGGRANSPEINKWGASITDIGVMENLQNSANVERRLFYEQNILSITVDADICSPMAIGDNVSGTILSLLGLKR